jgi:hypothetical protein
VSGRRPIRVRLAAFALPLLCVLGATAGPAQAETWATCTGMITSLPAVIGEQGVWCLGQDLSTNVGSGVAITVATNNVTIDCNGFKVGNLAAGTGTAAVGIRALARRNIGVRGCNVRGFATGIELSGSVVAPVSSTGHLVEDNLVEGSTTYGILVKGLNSIVRRNRLMDIGLNATTSPAAIAAIGTVDVLDNLVDGVAAAPGSYQTVWGIYASPSAGAVIARNQVRGVAAELGIAYGLYVAGTNGSVSLLRANIVIANTPTMRWVACSPGDAAVRRDNVLMGNPPYVAGDCSQFGDIVDP